MNTIQSPRYYYRGVSMGERGPSVTRTLFITHEDAAMLAISRELSRTGWVVVEVAPTLARPCWVKRRAADWKSMWRHHETAQRTVDLNTPRGRRIVARLARMANNPRRKRKAPRRTRKLAVS
jgi:hypothetical protein